MIKSAPTSLARPNFSWKILRHAPYFNYKPLPDGSIRLLRVEALNDDDQGITDGLDNDIRVSIHECPLSSSPTYFALSYTWGEPFPSIAADASVFTQVPRCYPINCCGSLLRGTRNLRDALRRILQLIKFIKCHPEDEHAIHDGDNTFELPEYFWIDALCINQDDLAERSVQVSIMDAIYSRAELCLVWLGEEDQFSRSAIRTMKDIIMDERNRVPKNIEGLTNFRTHFTTTIHNLDQEVSVALAQFLSRRWFFRLWVIQEVLLAPRVVMICGSLIFDFDILTQLARSLVAYNPFRLLEEVVDLDSQVAAAALQVPEILALIAKAQFTSHGNTTLNGST
jgi:hypothetical protein